MMGLITTLYVGLSLAQTAPAPFQNSEITRVLEDGTVQKFDGNKYKIVKRRPKKIEKNPSLILLERTVYKYEDRRKNRLTLYGGTGGTHLDGQLLGNNILQVNLKRGIVHGIGYSRDLSDEIHIQFIGISNETYLGGLGLEF